MYPGNSFNQIIQQTLKSSAIKQVTIELHETYGDRNKELTVLKDELRYMEYTDGVLTVELKDDSVDILPWDRIRKIHFSKNITTDLL